MSDVAKRHRDELPRLTKNVQNTYKYFEDNYKRFNEFRRFVFETSLTDDDKMVLQTLKKPSIEFNIGEAYISRLRGEFSKQQPSLVVTPEDGMQVPSPQLKVIEDHLRHQLFEADQNGFQYDVYTDILSGGFSAVKIWTEYASPMSFNQVIRFGRVYDPTLVGFDPLARQPHKGDGRFCFELFPMAREEFEEKYPGLDLRAIDFTRAVAGFNWTYVNNQEEVLLLCDYYEKKHKKKKIVKLVNGFVMTADDYELFVDEWNKAGLISQPPGVVGKPRTTEIETIDRYLFIENEMLEHKETDYPGLPLIYCGGNSVMLRQGTNQGSFKEFTRPYIFHLKGLQQLKNFAGQTLANELENLVQHKFKVAKESLPDEQPYLDAYTNIQLANTLVYKAFKDNDPKQPVPPPQEIARVPPPSEVISTFTLVDQMSQSILGSYDASLGINDNQLSGTAIVEGATQSNSAAMPYIVSFMQMMTRLGELNVKMYPKYYLTPRTIPTVDNQGKRDYKEINTPGEISFNYDENALRVKVEASINFAIQKAKSLQQLVALSQAMPIFGQFMNTKGLKVLVDNIDIHGSDELKELAQQFQIEMQQQQQQQQQMAQQQMQNNPAMLKLQNDQQKMMLEAKQKEAENIVRTAEVGVQKQQADIDFLKVLNEMHNAKREYQASLTKSQAEETRAAVDLAIKHVDMHHEHHMDRLNLLHEIHKTGMEARKDIE